LPTIGPMELIIVLVIALLVLGPKRLPDAGRSLGTGLREFKDSLSKVRVDDDQAPALGASSAEDAPTGQSVS
jgi:sec-independent protein translocase protein TatA